MASHGSKPAASLLLVLNLVLYFIVIVISSWAVNHAIEKTYESASGLPLPAKLFPIYFPIGNMATGFFVILSLIAGVVGFSTSLAGLHNIMIWNGPNLHAAASSSVISLALTLLAFGFACKEIQLGWTDSNLRTLEVMTILVSATQLFSTFAIQAGVEEAIVHEKFRAGTAGRV